MRGNVKWFDVKKGFGFIVGPEGQDVFIHYSQIQTEGFRLLKDGEEVEYELLETGKGFQAQNIQRVNPPADVRPAPRFNKREAAGTAAPAGGDEDARFNR